MFAKLRWNLCLLNQRNIIAETISLQSLALLFLATGIAMWTGQYLCTAALQTSAMRQVARIRTKFLQAVLHQDIGW